MSPKTLHRGTVNISISRSVEPVPCDGNCWREGWTQRCPDPNCLVVHRIEDGRLPTLRRVVDSSHWCDGYEGFMRHDPHEVDDEVHYECSACGTTVTPATYGYPHTHYITGMTSVEIEAKRVVDSALVTYHYYPDADDMHRIESVRRHQEDVEEVVWDMIDAAEAADDGRVYVVEMRSL